MRNFGLVSCQQFVKILRTLNAGNQVSPHINRSSLNIYYLNPACDEPSDHFREALETIDRNIDHNHSLMYPLTLTEFRSDVWKSSAKLLLVFDGSHHGEENYGDIHQLADFVAGGGRAMVFLEKPAYPSSPSHDWSHLVWTQHMDPSALVSDYSSWHWSFSDATQFHLWLPESTGIRLLFGSFGDPNSRPINLAILPMSTQLTNAVLRHALTLLDVECSVDPVTNGSIESPSVVDSQGNGATMYCLISNAAQKATLNSFSASITDSKLSIQDYANLDQLPAGFGWSEYSSNLSTRYLGQTLLWTESLESSWDLCDGMLASLPANSGLLVVSNRQTKAKGRGANQWISPSGQAAFTFHATLASPIAARSKNFANIVTCIQHLVALGVVLTFKSLVAERIGIAVPHDNEEEFLLGLEHSGPQVLVKWPNDVLVMDQSGHSSLGKLAGILTRCSMHGTDEANVLVGVGLNARNRIPTICLEEILDVIKPCSNGLTVAKVIAVMMNRLEHLIDRVLGVQGSTGGLKQALNWYTQCWVHSNQSVQVHSSPNSKSPPRDCVIVGLDDFGYLLVRDQSNGAEYTLHPDGNRMDMMKGLIIPK